MIVVDRTDFTLSLYERPEDSYEFVLEETYPIAIGAQGYNTPKGLYLINTKVRNPSWYVPNSKWAKKAGLKPGTVVPGDDPTNPIRERWLGVTDPQNGIGIHGTSAEDSIGTMASHGCIRMLPKDIIDLYSKVPIYTPVYII